MVPVLEVAGIIVAVLVVCMAAWVMTRPELLRVQRDATLPAGADAIFPLIDNFHNWRRWSPWENLDPELIRTYEGPEAGRGAVYAWKGNKNAGEGRMTILESVPNERIRIDLEFIKPFASRNDTTFTLTPASNGTHVEWLMEGPNSLFGKVMSFFMDMDKMIGKSFEQGLADLGTAARTNATIRTGASTSSSPDSESVTAK